MTGNPGRHHLSNDTPLSPKVEFATPTFNVLNALEQMGYKVVTSGAFVTGHNKFDQVRTLNIEVYWEKVAPRLRESCLLPPSGRIDEQYWARNYYLLRVA